VTITDTSGLHKIWKIVHQWEDRILPTRLDKRLEPVGAPKIEQLNMRLPEDGANVRRDALEDVT
jgi:hypothetical protein